MPVDCRHLINCVESTSQLPKSIDRKDSAKYAPSVNRSFRPSPSRLRIVAAIFCCVSFASCFGQTPRTAACTVFAADGSLATGTVRDGDLETRLDVPGSPVRTIHTSVGNASGCEEAVSSDGKWLATVVPGDKLTVLITDMKAGALHSRFSSEWHTFNGYPFERNRSMPLGGFAADNSIILYRDVPQQRAGRGGADGELHVQHWSTESRLLWEDNFGITDVGCGGDDPIAAQNLQRLWVPRGCFTRGYQGFTFDQRDWIADNSLTLPKHYTSTPVDVQNANRLLTVVGDRTNQKAALLDYSGKVDSEVSLPFFPNLLGPLVPDWFYVRQPAPSPDGRFAAIARTRVAWVLVDTDRDWGSEVLLLTLHPLSVIETLRTGRGGIGALALDHRNGAARLVGFWADHWHDLRWEEARKGKWQQTATW